ncbi:hypothetical protein [Acidaminobacter sp. JC074]|uniref:hypothetical protein n=1 Tax=Acidaminobacter sp. JC074 TaxID=2530199 RepID=UPI001F0FE5FF|nr:hypothetical protein [Acidaminobacter sp. JC074]
MKQLLLMIFLVLYIVSPVDLAPGPIDDIIILLLGLASRKKLVSPNPIIVDKEK